MEPFLAVYYLITLEFFSIDLSIALCILSMFCWVIVFSLYQRIIQSNRDRINYELSLKQHQIMKQRSVEQKLNSVHNSMKSNSTASVVSYASVTISHK